MLKRQLTTLLAAAALVLMSSCGGGGGGSDFVPPTDPGDLPITAENAESITASVLVAITSTMDLVGVVDVIGIPGISADSPMGVAFQKTTYPERIPCDAGEILVTWTDEDDDFEISTGDSFDLDFDACFFVDEDVTLDGIATLTGIVITGDVMNQTPPWALEVVFGFEQLQGQEPGGTVTIDGDLGLSVSTDDNLFIDIVVSSNSLSTEAGGVTETLSNLVETQRIDTTAFQMRITAQGALMSTDFDGTVTFETPMEFRAIMDDYPYEGQLLITDDSSSVLLTVLDNVNVQLDIDENLDGVIDDTLTVPWDDFGIE